MTVSHSRRLTRARRDPVRLAMIPDTPCQPASLAETWHVPSPGPAAPSNQRRPAAQAATVPKGPGPPPTARSNSQPRQTRPTAPDSSQTPPTPAPDSSQTRPTPAPGNSQHRQAPQPTAPGNQSHRTRPPTARDDDHGRPALAASSPRRYARQSTALSYRRPPARLPTAPGNQPRNRRRHTRQPTAQRRAAQEEPTAQRRAALRHPATGPATAHRCLARAARLPHRGHGQILPAGSASIRCSFKRVTPDTEAASLPYRDHYIMRQDPHGPLPGRSLWLRAATI